MGQNKEVMDHIRKLL